MIHFLIYGEDRHRRMDGRRDAGRHYRDLDRDADRHYRDADRHYRDADRDRPPPRRDDRRDFRFDRRDGRVPDVRPGAQYPYMTFPLHKVGKILSATTPTALPAVSPPPAGAVCEASGAVCEASGAVCEASGAVCEASGVVGEASGVVGEASGGVGEASGGVGAMCVDPQSVNDLLAEDVDFTEDLNTTLKLN